MVDSLPKGRDYIIVTDPPFNIGYHYDEYSDRLSDEEYYIGLATLVSKAGGKAVVIHYPEALHRLSMELKTPPSRVCAWVYNSNTPRQHRDIAYYGFSPKMSLMTQPFKNVGDKRIAERLERGITGGVLYDWYEVNQVKNVSNDKYDHPCQMPLKVMMNAIGVIPKDGNPVILDPFSGTGTTLVAARDLGFDFIGFEMSEKYRDIALDRLKGRTPSEIRANIEQLKLF